MASRTLIWTFPPASNWPSEAKLVPGPLRTLTLMVRLPWMGCGVAVAAGGRGVAVGVSVGISVGAGLAVAVGLAMDVGAAQAEMSRGRMVSRKMSRFIGVILLLFGWYRGKGGLLFWKRIRLIPEWDKVERNGCETLKTWVTPPKNVAHKEKVG